MILDKNTQIVNLTRQAPLSWAIMPEYLKRVKEFCSKYHSDTNGETLCRLIEMHFVAENPQFFMLVAVNSNGVKGHALAAIEVYYETKHLTIIQYELDQAISLEKREKGFEAMLSWGMLQGAEDVRLSTPAKLKMRTFARFYGFEPHRIVMRRPLIQKEK